MKKVYFNGRCFSNSTIEEVRRVFGNVAKKIIDIGTAIIVII